MNHKHVFVFSVFLFSIISFLFDVHIPVIWPDEVLFFNPAWELANNGVMRTSVLNGLIPGMDTHTLWMPPLYIIFLSGIFQFFPAELLSARLFSSFISLWTIFIVYRICLRLEFSSKRIIGVLIFLSTDFLFLKFSHTARMESLCLFFALVAFMFLLKSDFSGSISDSQPTNVNIFLSGISLSLSFLSHPFGIVHSIPILFLLYQRNSLSIRSILLYSIAGIIPISLWAVYIIPNWDLFITQFGAQLARKNELLGKFTIVDKVKIIFSVYKFPIIKLALFLMTIFLVFYNLALNILRKNKANLEKIVSLKKSQDVFFLVWIFTILGFLFISSESWYVFQIVVPFTLLLSALIEKKSIYFRSFILLSCLYNLIVLFWVPYTNFILHRMPEKTKEFFRLIDLEVERKNNIYLQAIPDPYFHLREKFPDKNLHEFIPGELSEVKLKKAGESENKSFLQKLGIVKENYKIDASFYKEEIHKQEVFIFYNENLMNEYIRKYLFENSDRFERKVIHVNTPKGSEIKLDAVIYRQK